MTGTFRPLEQAETPQRICALFRDAMANRDLDAALALYDADAVFVDEHGEVTRDLRQALAGQAGARFDFRPRRIVETGDTALMHTEWTVSSGGGVRRVHAIEVARRQRDGTWRWLIGDPFTVAKTNRLIES